MSGHFDEYFDLVKARLNSLGIRVDNDAAILINMCIERAEGTIKHTCNLSAVPAGLETILVDMAVGEFLLTQKTFGKLMESTSMRRLLSKSRWGIPTSATVRILQRARSSGLTLSYPILRGTGRKSC